MIGRIEMFWAFHDVMKMSADSRDAKH